MLSPDENGVLMRIEPSAGRVFAAVLVYFALGGLLVLVALSGTIGAGAAIALFLLGCLALFNGERFRRSSKRAIELTELDLRDSSGDILAKWSEIEKVDRGTFAIKPSNGFALILQSPAGRRWVPGLWWRIGRRVGVGGMLPARETRFMAEYLALELGQK